MYPVPCTLNAQETLTMDLKGIEAQELFKVLSLKTGITIVPTKSVSGRINIFLNNLTLDDALEVIMISQDLACEKNGDIINIMTSAEYEKLYGKRYNEKREFKTIKLTYAKPSTVFNALGQIKSDIGKIIVDESSGVIFLIDIPEKIQLMSDKAAQLDQQLVTDVFYLNYVSAKAAKEYLSGLVTPGLGEAWIDERTNKVMVNDMPDRIKKIRRLMKNFDVPAEEVFVEVTVLELTLNDEFQRAINWEALINRNGAGKVDITGVYPVASSFTPAVDMANDYLKMTVGNVHDDGFNVILNLLSTLGDVKVVTHDYLSIINREEAHLTVSYREPIVQQELNTGAASTIIADKIDFVDVGMILKVKPEIHDREFISLRVSVESTVLSSILQTEKSYIPIVGRNEAEVTLKVKDETTIMMAGLSSRDCRKTLATQPLEPFLPGSSFMGAEASRGKLSELLIFLRPIRYGKK
jgi:type II secretory pathway component GspD/PulD (secretin)